MDLDLSLLNLDMGSIGSNKTLLDIENDWQEADLWLNDGDIGIDETLLGCSTSNSTELRLISSDMISNSRS